MLRPKLIILRAMKKVLTKCCVCEEQMSRYKCPSCFIQYCSVNCYKNHKKGVCGTPEQQIPDVTPVIPTPAAPVIPTAAAAAALVIPTVTPAAVPVLVTTPLSNEEADDDDDFRCLNIEESEDRVPVESLHLLGESHDVKQLLQNQHLREILLNLYQDGKTATAHIESAMKEPLFIELAQTCLTTIKQ
ncbi:zinc finger HIT domain-containing protein 3-like [Tubulanus polymorphus]|uniref:zinc finger HIT domain-containing protein 3-like n=1 Tax=Tubulanus polymorphus TaxID=672921 RepID=UPI003DA49E6A